MEETKKNRRMTQLSLEHRARLAEGVYNTLDEGTESFEVDNMGAYLAYLMGAILRDDLSRKGVHLGVGLTLDDPGAVAFVHILRKKYPVDSVLWKYIFLQGRTNLEEFPDSVKKAIIDGKELGNIDEEDYPEAGAWVEALKDYAAKDK